MINEEFKKELTALINKYSIENGSNTPDFILADYLIKCIENYNQITKTRENWYGRGTNYVKTNVNIPNPPDWPEYQVMYESDDKNIK